SSNIELEPGESYCVTVAARSDVDAFGHQIESAQTRVNGGSLAFTYEPRVWRCTKASKDERDAEADETLAQEDEEAGELEKAEELRSAAEGLQLAAEEI